MNSIKHVLLIYNFIVIIFSALLVAANSSSTELGKFNVNGDFSNGISSFALPAEERMIVDSYVLAFINYTFIDNNGDRQTFAEDKAKYGEGKILNVEGKLVHITSAKDINDNTACDTNIRGTKGEPLPARNVSWIALIKRGHCNFEDKVRNVYTYNAVGVIIYNDKDAITLDKMKINDKERNITAIFTYKSNGEQMANLLEVYDLYTSISEGTRCTKQIPNINRTSVLFVSISFIALMIISLVWLAFYYVQRFRYLQTKDKQSRRMCTVAKRIISKIPTKSIKSDDKELENDCCPVCIELYKVTDVIRILPCKHEFHKNCIDPWLLEHRTCPMCKMDILKHYGFVFTGSQESILQLDMDVEDGDIDVMSESSPRRDGISPLPQIRSSEQVLSRSSSMNSDFDRDIQSTHEGTPSLSNWTSKNNKKLEVGIGYETSIRQNHQYLEDMLSDTDEIINAECCSLTSPLKDYQISPSHTESQMITGSQPYLNENNNSTNVDNTSNQSENINVKTNLSNNDNFI